MKTTIAPWLNVRGSVKAVEFYKAAFGAEEVYRNEITPESVISRLSIEGAEFWVGDEFPEHAHPSPQTLNGSTIRLILVVADPDAVFARASAAGATQVFAVTEGHGWRVGGVIDPFGHHWEIGHPLGA